MDQKSLGLIAGHNGAELLDRPRGCGVLGHVPMHDPTCADVQDHEDVHGAECCGRRHEEVTRERGVGVVANEGAPPLRRRARASRRGYVPPHRPRRHADPQLELQFAAIRSSPHVAFARAMVAIRRCTWPWSGGRPHGCDFHRQKRRNRFRCHRSIVSGFTMVRAARQSIRRARTTSVIRVASSARRGRTPRSA